MDKYGKKIEMRTINRNVSSIKEMIDKTKRDCIRCFRSEKSSHEGKCRVCDSKEVIPFMTINGQYRYYQCSSCGSLFLDNLPDMDKLYQGEDSGNIKTYIDNSVYEKRVEMISAPKVNFVLDTIKDNNDKVSKWVDIGCGGGEILSYLKKNTTISGIGIESDPLECKFMLDKGLSVYQSYINLEEEDKKLSNIIRESDVISFINLLEHVPLPVEFIEYIYRNMSEGSYLVFEVPRHPSLASFVNLTSCNNIYRHIVPPIHLQIFSDEAINRLLKNKFTICSRWFFGQGFTDILTNSMILSGIDSNPLYDLIYKHSNEIQQTIDSEGLADQVLIVAKKSSNEMPSK